MGINWGNTWGEFGSDNGPSESIGDSGAYTSYSGAGAGGNNWSSNVDWSQIFSGAMGLASQYFNRPDSGFKTPKMTPEQREMYETIREMIKDRQGQNDALGGVYTSMLGKYGGGQTTDHPGAVDIPALGVKGGRMYKPSTNGIDISALESYWKDRAGDSSRGAGGGGTPHDPTPMLDPEEREDQRGRAYNRTTSEDESGSGWGILGHRSTGATEGMDSDEMRAYLEANGVAWGDIRSSIQSFRSNPEYARMYAQYGPKAFGMIGTAALGPLGGLIAAFGADRVGRWIFKPARGGGK